MQETLEALQEGFEWDKEDKYWSFKFGRNYELTFEPIGYDRMYVGLYHREELLISKIAIKPGKISIKE